MKVVLFTCFFVLGSVLQSQAALTLLLNPSRERITVTGTDTGLSEDLGPFDALRWEIGIVPTGDPENILLLTPAINGSLSLNFGLSFFPNGFALQGGDDNPITMLTGNGTLLPYQNLTSGQKALLESNIGNSMILDLGTGYSPVSIELIPEPGAYALLAGLGALLTLAVARRRGD